MANDKTGIEWTDATWNPTVGCSLVSPGCTNCYAMKQAHRIQTMADAAASKKAGGLKLNTSDYAGTTKVVKNTPVWTGMVKMLPKRLTQPLRWTKPRTVFVNSMSDLFHESLTDHEIDQVFAVMAITPQHTYQVLTKRPARMRAYLNNPELGQRLLPILMPAARGNVGAEMLVMDIVHQLRVREKPLANLHVGTSVENQVRFDERALELAKTRAAVRFLSCEPLLGPVTMSGMLGNFDWVIVGGESGPDARPMHPDWARRLRDECAKYDTPFFFKQWGEFGPPQTEEQLAEFASGKGHFGQLQPSGSFDPGDSGVLRLGKKRTGSLLDGREHKEMPHQDRADLHLIGQPR